MKKRWIRLTFFPIAAILTMGVLAAAGSGAMAGLEQKWMSFRRAVSARQVRSGILTEEQARSQLSKLEARQKDEGDADGIAGKIAKRFAVDGKNRRERGNEGKIIRVEVGQPSLEQNIGIWRSQSSAG
jgi:hypothetical protein